MSEEQLKAFMEAVKADAGLQEKLKAAADSNAVVAIAKEMGFMITTEELQWAQAVVEELSDEELDGVAGGGGVSYPNVKKAFGGPFMLGFGVGWDSGGMCV